MSDCECDNCLKVLVDKQHSYEEMRKEMTEREKYRAHFKTFIRKIESAGFEIIGNGGFRDTYQRKGVVIKIPRNRDGEIDNIVESTAWHKYKSSVTSLGIYLAPCRILHNGCLMMATVKLLPNFESCPKWVKGMHDGWQVGTYKDRIVAYDYALEIAERTEWEDEWGFHSDFFQKEFVKKKLAFQRKRKVA